jgi:hypothetical protein
MVRRAKKQIQKPQATTSKEKAKKKAKKKSKAGAKSAPIHPRDFDTWAGLVRYLGEDCELLDHEPLYAMPMQLIDLVKKELPELLVGMEKKERRLTKLCAEKDIIGFAWQRGVSSLLLHTRCADAVNADTLKTVYEGFRASQDKKEAAYTKLQVKLMLGKLEKRSRDVDSRLAGYAGWLMSTPQFLEELSELKGKGAAIVSEAREFPQISWLHGDATLRDAGRLVRMSRKESAFRNDYRDFCKKWCLNRLVTWELPEPTGPSGCRLVAGIIPDLAQQGVGVFIPYGFVNPTKIDLSQLVKNLRGCTAPEHLRDWVDEGLQARKGAGSKRFAQFFVFKHYWEIIESRYGEWLWKKKGGLKHILGKFLCGEGSWTSPRGKGHALGGKLYTMLNRSRRELENR